MYNVNIYKHADRERLNMGITIKELAEISGYSASTISRVIANKGNVKEETRKEIEKLIIEQNYRTNVMDLRSSEQNLHIIMIVIGELENVYYLDLIQVIKRELKEQGYTVMIAYTDNSEEEEMNYIKMAARSRFGGTIFINVRGGNELAQLLTESELPVVFLNRGIRFADFDTVINDNYQGGYMITDYLIQRGHRKIGHLMGHTYSSTAQERRRGYEDAMRDAKLPVTNNNVYIGKLNYESGYDYGEYLVKRGLDYTAVFCSNDMMALGLWRSLEASGLKVPDDISIASYDSTMYAQSAGLTTISAPSERLAKKGVQMLRARINGDRIDGGTVVLRPQIIERISVKSIK